MNPWPIMSSSEPKFKPILEIPFVRGLDEDNEKILKKQLYLHGPHKQSGLRQWISDTTKISVENLIKEHVSRINFEPLKVGVPGHRRTQVFTTFRCSEDIFEMLLGRTYSGKRFTVDPTDNKNADKTDGIEISGLTIEIMSRDGPKSVMD